MKKYALAHYLCLGFAGLLSAPVHPVYAADNMYFHGALVAQPCVIPDGKDTIEINFGGVINNDLYVNTRTAGKPFTIQLENCDTSLASMMSVSFTGTPNASLPNFLALDGSSKAAGVAIGMETMGGEMWPLNKPGPQYPINPGSNEIRINAYIQAESNAITTRSIKPGDFTASATFTLAYE